MFFEPYITQNKTNFMLFTRILRIFIIFCCCLGIWLTSPSLSWADIDNDRYDGNMFVVYAGNGSLVPPKLTLEQSFARNLPVILTYYLDDNSDSKQFAFIISTMQEFYGRAASLIPVSVDTILPKDKYEPTEAGYYYRGAIPQTVVLDQNGNKVFDEIGQIEYGQVDDALRKVFNLVPRSESVELKRKTFNQFNSELVPTDNSQ